MNTDYNCIVEINLSGGDISIEVTGDGQKFNFQSGIGFVALPNFFFILSNFYKRELDEVQLVCHGNSDYYNLTSDGNSLQIEHTSHYTEDDKYNYTFNLKNYVMAVDKGFSKYLQQFYKDGKLPLEFYEMSHPLAPNVIKEYNEFSSLINRRIIN